MAERKRRRKRAPGGGRKPLAPDEAQSVKVMVRVRPALRKALQNLADKHHGGNVSREIKLALRHWVNRHEIPQLYNSALATAIAVLADRIERITGEKWTADPLTHEVVREHVERLVSHLLPPAPQPIAVPADIKKDAELLLSLLIHSMSRDGSRRFAGTVIIDDPGLVTILQDLARDLGDGRAIIETRSELVARRERDETAWANAMRAGDAAAFADYIQRFRFGRHVTQAWKRLASLEDQRRRN
jgi:hypothetical protein